MIAKSAQGQEPAKPIRLQNQLLQTFDRMKSAIINEI
jgi:hypothetical protein